MQSIEEDENLIDDNPAVSGADGRPSWIRNLAKAVQDYQQQLPPKITLMERTAEKIKDPLFRFFEREIREGAKLLNHVRKDLQDVTAVCEGNLKLSNYLRGIMQNLSKGVIPKEWLKYHVPESTSLSLWFVDFINRIKQLQEISKMTNFSQRNIWVGGLFSPEAFMTATRQVVAQANSWALETLTLDVSVSDKPIQPTAKDHTFVVIGLTLEGTSFEFSKGELGAAAESSCPLPYCSFTWRQSISDPRPRVTLPIYLNETRRDLLFSVDLSLPANVPSATYYQRGVGLTAWSPLIHTQS